MLLNRGRKFWPALVLLAAPILAFAAAPARRVTASYGDITCEYPEGQERLAWELAKRFAAHAESLDAGQRGLEPMADASVPLSAAELRAGREDYLKRIADLVAFENPTALQATRFDESLRNYERSMNFAADRRRHAGDVAQVRKFAIWMRSDRAHPEEQPPRMGYDDSRRADVFWVVVPDDAAALPPAELAEQLFKRDGEISVALEALSRLPGNFPGTDPQTASRVLRDAAEAGLTERYFGGNDRIWFAEGVANYVAWRVVRDRHGEPIARSAYDLAGELARHRDLAPVADPRRLNSPTVPPSGVAASDLESARRAYATRAVFLMHEKAGEDLLPRLFREIGRTRPNRVTMATVEKAWARVSRVKLDAVLAEAVAVPASAAVESAR